MTDDEFRKLFIDHFTGLLIDDQRWPEYEARRVAEKEYDRCPRSEIATWLQADPQACADEVYCDWADIQEEEDFSRES